MSQSPETTPPTPFRVSFVTGVTPDKWARTWRRRPLGPLELTPADEAGQLDPLRAGDVDMAFVRLPVERAGLHLIPLYREVPVVVVSREHPVAAYDEIPVEDLADEHLLQDPDDVPAWRDLATEVRVGTRYPVPPMTLKQAIESVAAQAGVVVLPMSVARQHHRKDVVAVPVLGVPESHVGLAWPQESDDPRIEAFIGVVRGRTERSSRGETAAQPAAKAPAKTTPATQRGTKSSKGAKGSSAKRQPSRGNPRRGRGRR